MVAGAFRVGLAGGVMDGGPGNGGWASPVATAVASGAPCDAADLAVDLERDAQALLRRSVKARTVEKPPPVSGVIGAASGQRHGKARGGEQAHRTLAVNRS